MYRVNYLSNGTWQDAEDKCALSNANLWTPSGHAEWLNIYNVLMSAHWESDLTIYQMTNLILLSNLIFIGMHCVNDVSMLKNIIH